MKKTFLGSKNLHASNCLGAVGQERCQIIKMAIRFMDNLKHPKVMSILLVLFASSSAVAHESVVMTALRTHFPISDEYNPITPGTPEWISYNPADKSNWRQLPEGILNTISTYGLARYCLTCPFYEKALCSSSPPYGETVKEIASRFNGLEELFHRVDRGVVLTQLYKDVILVTELDSMRVQQHPGDYFYLGVVCIMLRHEDVLSSFTIEESKQLLVHCIERLESGDELAEICGPRYSGSAIRWANSIIGEILLSLSYPPFLEYFELDPQTSRSLQTTEMFRSQSPALYADFARRYISEK